MANFECQQLEIGLEYAQWSFVQRNIFCEGSSEPKKDAQVDQVWVAAPRVFLLELLVCLRLWICLDTVVMITASLDLYLGVLLLEIELFGCLLVWISNNTEVSEAFRKWGVDRFQRSSNDFSNFVIVIPYIAVFCVLVLSGFVGLDDVAVDIVSEWFGSLFTEIHNKRH